MILRRQEPWKGALDAALRRWEVPCFLDYPRSVEAEPIMRFVLEAFGVVNHSFRSDEIFSLLKTGPFRPFSPGVRPIGKLCLSLEDYRKKVAGRVDGESGGLCGEIYPRAGGFAGTAQQPAPPGDGTFRAVSRSLQNADGQEAAQAVYRLLTDFGVEETLPALCRSLRESGQGEAADRQLRLWDVLMNILDQTAMVLKDRRLDPER